MSVPASATVPLHYPRFRNLWIASVVTSLGSFLQTVAGSWLMLELTGSALWVGLMVAAPTLPMLLVAMPAGAMADLFDRRRILLLAQSLMAASAALMAVFTIAGGITPGLLLGLGLLLGFGQCLNMPSWQAIVPDLVPGEHVASAVALNSAAFNVARSVGPALGGLLVATAGPGPAFALNALSYLAVIGVIFTYREHTSRQEQPASIMTAIAGGVRYARYTPSFRWLLAVAATFAITSAAIQSVLPTHTDQTLAGGADLYGVLLGCMGVGALVGAFTRPRALAVLGRRMVPSAIAAFGVAGIAFGAAPHPALAGLAMGVIGVLWVWILSTLNATTQLLSPAWVRGRIMSLYTMAFIGITPLGSVLAGALADLAGTRVALIGLSCGTLLLGLAVTRAPLPVLSEVTTPRTFDDFVESSPHPAQVDGGPVMVLTTWRIADRDLEAYLRSMDDLRRVRLRTGAYRWRLYRDVTDPHRMTEAFLCSSWSQHLAQHRRIDEHAAQVIRHARAFDRDGDARTWHLAAVDVSDPLHLPVWEDLEAHQDMHRNDDSTPLERRGTTTRR